MVANGFVEIILDDKDVEAGLANLARLLSPESIDLFLGESVVPFLRERADFRFSNEGDTASGKWEALRPATVRARAYGIETGEYTGIGPEHPINKRTGELESYILGSDGLLVGEGTVLWPNPNARDGDIDEKLGRAQGLDPNTVQRAVLAIDEDDVVIVMGKLVDFLSGGLKTA